MRTTSPRRDVLLERHLELLELGGPLGHRFGPLGEHQRGQRVGFGLELLGTGDEVGLALELDDRADVAVDEEADDALGVVAVLTVGAGGETLLTEPDLGGLDVAVGRLEGLLAVHHARAGRVAQGLHVLCGERHR